MGLGLEAHRLRVESKGLRFGVHLLRVEQCNV